MNPHSRWKWDASAERPLWWEWNARVGLSLEDGVRPSVEAGACGQTRMGSAPARVWLTPVTASLLPNAAPRTASPSPTLGHAWGTQAWSLGTRGSEAQAPQLSMPGGEHSGNRSPRASWLQVQVLGDCAGAAPILSPRTYPEKAPSMGRGGPASLPCRD